MIERTNQKREIEEMLIREFSSFSKLDDRFTFAGSPVTITENMQIVTSGKYIQSNVRSYHSNAKGICSNCLNFKDCQLPKNPTGVWHCEEYV